MYENKCVKINRQAKSRAHNYCTRLGVKGPIESVAQCVARACAISATCRASSHSWEGRHHATIIPMRRTCLKISGLLEGEPDRQDTRPPRTDDSSASLASFSQPRD